MAVFLSFIQAAS